MTSLATDLGLKAFVNAMVAANTPFVGWGGGSGQGEASIGMASEFSEGRVAASPVAATTTTPSDTYRVNAALTAGQARVVTEVGIFATGAGADMQFYGDFPAINLNAGDSIAFTIDVVVDQL